MITVLPSNGVLVFLASAAAVIFSLMAAAFYYFGQRSILGYPAAWLSLSGVLVAGLAMGFLLKGWAKVEDDVLTLHAPFSTASFNLNDLDLQSAAQRERNANPKMVLRLLGVSMLGFKSGVFGTSDRKAVLVLLNGSAGVFVPGKSVDGRFDGMVIEPEILELIKESDLTVGQAHVT